MFVGSDAHSSRNPPRQCRAGWVAVATAKLPLWFGHGLAVIARRIRLSRAAFVRSSICSAFFGLTSVSRTGSDISVV